MPKTNWFLTVLCCACSVLTTAQEGVVKQQLSAQRIPAAPAIDGKLDDAVWLSAPVATDFVQNRPNPGAAPSQRTEVKVLYDNDAVYVGMYNYDNAADSILHQLSQRDQIENTDWCGMWFSCFQDGINAFEFFVTPDGVQIDAQVSANGEDFNWNAVWQCNTTITEDGWVAEFKIPFSALRFPERDVQTWDINFTRVIRRHREQLFWQEVDPEVAGFINQSGQLNGVEHVQAPVRLFFYPYASAYLERATDNNGNAVYGSSYNGGMDVKFGINDAFTLDATLIPDFGQVQSDNLVLNLSPFEVRFNENRQFFTEGTELFNKGGLFYSRRVGGTPVNFGDAYDNVQENEVVEDLPGTTQLLNAVKVSGRNENGTGLGVFNAVAGREFATIRDTITDQLRQVEVNPLTNYSILVVDQNLPNNSYATLINTNVMRNGGTYDANVTGTEFELRNKKNSYSISGSGAYNRKFGWDDPAAEDGHRWNLSLSKLNGNFNFDLQTSVESDTYDPNDLGFLFNNNEQWSSLEVSYNIFEPFGPFNRMWSTFNLNHSRLYDPRVWIRTNFSGKVGFNTRKFHSFGFNFAGEPWGNRDYFGPRNDGYFQQNPENYNYSVWLSTDYRRRLAVDIRTWNNQTTQEGRYSRNWRFAPRIRVNDKLFFSYVYSWQRNFNGEGYAFQNNFPDQDIVAQYEDDIIYARRDVTSHTQVLNARYIFTNRMGVTCRIRHYWSYLENRAFLELQEDGSVIDSDFPGLRDDGTSPLDQSFNAFNIDLVYTWVFSPGSELRMVWKKSIATNMDQDQRIPAWSDNFQQTLQAPGLDSFSIRILYFVDYLSLRRGQKLVLN